MIKVFFFTEMYVHRYDQGRMFLTELLKTFAIQNWDFFGGEIDSIKEDELEESMDPYEKLKQLRDMECNT